MGLCGPLGAEERLAKRVCYHFIVLFLPFMATTGLDINLLTVRPPGFAGCVQKAVRPLWGSGLGPLASLGVEGHLTKRVWDSYGQQNTLSLLREGSILA